MFFYLQNNLVLTSSLDNRNVADLNNISQVILDYHGTIKYTVFEPTMKQVYVVDKDDKMYLFNSKIFSHTGKWSDAIRLMALSLYSLLNTILFFFIVEFTGSIKWGKEHSRFSLIDLSSYPFEYFFFAGKDLYTKFKNRNEFSFIRNFGECLKDWVSWFLFLCSRTCSKLRTLFYDS